jgi:predicted nucleic-acid-binding protein
MVYADANVFLRFILNDNKEMADYAEKLLNNHEAFLLHEVIAEMVYVLNGVYNIKRQDISKELTNLLAYAETEDKAVMIQALKNYSQTKLDFVDCILLAYSIIQHTEIATFDKKLLNKIKSTSDK